VGAGGVSLRDAIFAAAPADDRIEFDPTAANVNGGTILLQHGEIVFGKSLTIDASMLSAGITIDAGDITTTPGDGIRIFNITDPISGDDSPLVTLRGLTLKGGDPSSSSQSGNGGAILSAAWLKILNCTIEQNDAHSGGGIHIEVAGGSHSTSREVLTIEDSIIRNNKARAGGGIDINTSATTADVFSIKRTTIRDNEAYWPSSQYGGGGIYAVLLGAQLKVTDSLISGNSAAAPSGSSYFASGGGGLYVKLLESASLTVDNTVVHDNHATSGSGGGILAKAFLNSQNPDPSPQAVTITRSTISENTADDQGGGLFVFSQEGTEVLVEESRVTGNEVPAEATGSDRNGGGIYAYLYGNSSGTNLPKWTITRSTVDNNKAEHEGGGIFVRGHFGNFIATNTTISDNETTNESTGMGGGIFVTRNPDVASASIDAYLRNVTVTKNTSADGGVRTANLSNVRVRIANSIISENVNHQSAANNLDGRVMKDDLKHNLIGTGSTLLDHATGAVVYQDSPFINTIPASNNNIMGSVANTPGLEPLSNNGGPTPTHRLSNNSQAIDQGSTVLAEDPLTGVDFSTDQRGEGFARVWNITTVADGPAGNVDIGAYEIGLPKVIDVIISDSTVTPHAHTPYSFATAFGLGIRQLRSVPVGNADTIEVRFSEAVTPLTNSQITVQDKSAGFFAGGIVSTTDTSAAW
jgi:hypothetical protein